MERRRAREKEGTREHGERERQLREKNAPKWEKVIRAYGVGETTTRRRCTAENGGKCPAKPTEGRPAREFTYNIYDVNGYM